MRLSLIAALLLLAVAGTGCRSVNVCKKCNDCGQGGQVGHGHGGHGGHLAQGGHAGHGGHGGHGGHAYGEGPLGHGPHGTPGYRGHRDREYVGPQGPPTAQVAYPYYTIRGPRDFLIDNPPSIGPY